MSSIVGNSSWVRFVKRGLVLSGLMVGALSLSATMLRAQEVTSRAKVDCISGEMVRLLVRDGSSVHVSRGNEGLGQQDGTRENEKGIALAQDGEKARTLVEARKWFVKSAQKGYAPAQVNLAVLSLAGWGGPQNAGTALYWLREAARQGYALAYFDLGILYMGGCGVRQDYNEAFNYFEQGADAGDASAQMNVGYLYDKGLGVAQDHSKAAAWYRKSAESRVAQAQYNLGDLYAQGEGLPLDEHAAFVWFEKAALQGHAGARFMIGTMYASGRGTQKDSMAAYTWLSAAALQGDARGNVELKSLELKLDATQVAEAKLRAQSLIHASRQGGSPEVALLH